jgi:hypothetical protein
MTRPLWIEVALLSALCAIAAATLASVPGNWGWSWDALNHHVYLGHISGTQRWQLDVMAANVQSLQYPYLYWPVALLAQSPLSGAQAAALWGATLTLLLVPPLWLLAWRLLPQQGHPAQAVFERGAATLLGLSSMVVIAGLGTTANDPLATVPLLWAIAWMAEPQASDRRAALAAALWGVSVAFKLSNVLALPLLLVWWWRGLPRPLPLRRGWGIALGAAAGYGLAYAPWGVQLWAWSGNPFYPFLDSFFRP